MGLFGIIEGKGGGPGKDSSRRLPPVTRDWLSAPSYCISTLAGAAEVLAGAVQDKGVASVAFVPFTVDLLVK